jgi:hypothetical protein
MKSMRQAGDAAAQMTAVACHVRLRSCASFDLAFAEFAIQKTDGVSALRQGPLHVFGFAVHIAEDDGLGRQVASPAI